MAKKIVNKYLIILLIYLVLIRFVSYYSLQFYYTFANDPIQLPFTAASFQSFMTATTFIFNLAIVVIMLADSKAKKLTDWLICIVTFFNVEIGITLFIVWNIYKDLLKTRELT